MAQAPAIPAETAAEEGPMVWPAGHAAPVTPGKVAMWLFLATEVMFFTGLIGSYIVLRAGSPPDAYSNHYPPGTDPVTIDASRSYDVVLESVGTERGRALALVRSVSG